jgi:hypothetical protein
VAADHAGDQIRALISGASPVNGAFFSKVIANLRAINTVGAFAHQKNTGDKMKLEPLLRMQVELGTRYPIGLIPKGRRTVWALASGTVEGPHIRGEVMPVGGEFELIDSDGFYHIDVRLVIRTEDKANIFVQYFGVLKMTPELIEKFQKKEEVDFGDSYFVTQPRFETSHKNYSWLNHAMAVGEGRGTGTGVDYLIYHCVPDKAIALAGVPKHFGYKGEKA